VRFYASNSGRIVCGRHGGAYLESALRAGEVGQIATPLDVWDRLTAAEVAEWTAYTDGHPCEVERYGGPLAGHAGPCGDVEP
jgi:hypothetical protein